jgi:hypothetical protein
LFQKALKYGLPDWLSISCFELGFADRVVAQRLRDVVVEAGFAGESFTAALEARKSELEAALTDYPSYFMSVFTSRS